MEKPLILPSEIPWQDIKGSNLEELLYWLFDSMGAKELEWRIGGKGAGTSDQGRDLELVFFTPSPDGTLSRQTWWVEAKGRTGTVEPSAVQEAVLNAAGKSHVEVLVVATNANFSNPTRDWVKEWQRSHPRPIVKLWERTELENLCSKNPIAVIRLHSKALSPQGRVEVSKSKLWDYASFTDEPALMEMWKNRSDISIDETSLFALVASEMANGSITNRSWGLIASDGVLAASLCNGILNFLYLAFRARERGLRQAPIIQAICYFVLISVDRLGKEAVANLLSNVWHELDESKFPSEVQKVILEPVLTTLQAQLKDVCTSDCRRIMTQPEVLNEQEVEVYWDRLKISEPVSNESRRILTIEKTTEPCKVGFNLNEKVGCPLCNPESPHENIEEFIDTIDKLMRFRGGCSKNA
jgi:hypothetical protein